MKAIQINFEGMVGSRFSTISRTDNRTGFCYISDRAARFIMAQSVDGIVYDGSGYYNGLGNVCAEHEPCNNIFCRSNGDIARYYVKGEVYDDSNPFAMPKKGEWQWKWVEIRVIDIMD